MLATTKCGLVATHLKNGSPLPQRIQKLKSAAIRTTAGATEATKKTPRLIGKQKRLLRESKKPSRAHWPGLTSCPSNRDSNPLGSIVAPSLLLAELLVETACEVRLVSPMLLELFDKLGGYLFVRNLACCRWHRDLPSYFITH